MKKHLSKKILLAFFSTLATMTVAGASGNNSPKIPTKRIEKADLQPVSPVPQPAKKQKSPPPLPKSPRKSTSYFTYQQKYYLVESAKIILIFYVVDSIYKLIIPNVYPIYPKIDNPADDTVGDTFWKIYKGWEYLLLGTKPDPKNTIYEPIPSKIFRFLEVSSITSVIYCYLKGRKK